MDPPPGSALDSAPQRAWRARIASSALLLASACAEAHLRAEPKDASTDPASPSEENGAEDIDAGAQDATADAAQDAAVPTRDAANATHPRDAADATYARDAADAPHARDAAGARPEASADGSAAGLSCDAQHKLAVQRVFTAADSSDQSCHVDSDCQLMDAKASCSEYCVAALVSNEPGAREVRSALEVIERDICDDYDRAGCPRLHTECSTQRALLRCREGRCAAAWVLCPEGCASAAGEPCTAYPDYFCEGCPGVPSEADGTPCAKPGQHCTYPPSCGGADAECVQDESGEARWSVTFRLC
jgi:hypothetical protein